MTTNDTAKRMTFLFMAFSLSMKPGVTKRGRCPSYHRSVSDPDTLDRPIPPSPMKAVTS